MADIAVLNTSGDLTGKTLLTAENNYTVSGTYTFTAVPIFSTALVLGAATTSGIRLEVDGGVLGVREGDDTAFAPITAGALIATSAAFSGVVTKTAQPAFLAKSALQSNVTGDGTVYNVLFATESFDQANNFSSPTFTAPVTGKYWLSVNILASGLTTSHTSAYVELLVNSVGYYSQLVRSAEYVGDDTWTASVGVLVAMTAGHTATVNLVVSGSTKVVDIGANNSFFCGYLVA